jgi:putative spermidine/putrescine transport system ATP-binding protein
LVVRPEHMLIDQDADCRVSARIVEAVYAGVETRLILRRASGTELIVRRAAAAGGVEIGAMVEVGWNRDSSMLVLT